MKQLPELALSLPETAWLLFGIVILISPGMLSLRHTLKEALGWVRGSLGLDAKIKPSSFAATHAADHAVRHLN